MRGHGDLLVLLALVTVNRDCSSGRAVPFPPWAPDVYEGSPRRSRVYSVASKTASFALLLRLLLTVFGRSSGLGDAGGGRRRYASAHRCNFAAITQTNIKRMLATLRFPMWDTYCSASWRGIERAGLHDRNERRRILFVRVWIHDHRRVRVVIVLAAARGH